MYEIFEKIIIQTGLPEPIREFRFNPARRWRIDYAWPDYMLAVEIEGGIFSNGRHVRGSGFKSDIEKYNEIELLGYTLLRFTPNQLLNYGIATLERFFASK